MNYDYIFGAIVLILAGFLFVCNVYQRGYDKAQALCEQEKQELAIQYESEKNGILSQVYKKSPADRRKELERYVIY